MLKRDLLSWWFRPQFLQPWGKKKRVLFTAPWVGEFGWELMNWQAFVRWLAPEYEKVIVCCRPGMESLYQDFADEIIHHNIKGTAECNVAHNIQNPEEIARILALVPQNADYLPALGWQPAKRKTFIKFGEYRDLLQSDIVFHPRGRGFGTDRNWSEQKWEDLIAQLNELGLKIKCIGMKNATLDIRGEFEDLRDQALSDTMDTLASTKLIIGPSSGPMHLASLCKTPHIVWTDQKGYARGRTNRVKYENWWNPHQAEAYVLDEEGFDPSVQLVLHQIEKVLEN